MDYDKDKHIETLETTNAALVDKITYLNKRQMKRNTETSLKWRGKALYYRKKIERLLTYIKNNGLEVPNGKFYHNGESEMGREMQTPERAKSFREHSGE